MTQTLQRKFCKPSELSNALKCIICSEVYIQPTRLYCTHSFCHQCINQWSKNKDHCPVCRTKIDKKNIGPDLVAHNIIDQLEVFCPVEDCPWRGINRQLQHHYENQCEYRDKAKEKNTGKSHKKTKLINLQFWKDEQVEEKINSNLIKGSLQARILAERRKQCGVSANQPMINQNSNSSSNFRNAEQNGNPTGEIKKTGTYDFLQDLFG